MSARAITPMGKEACRQIIPLEDREACLFELQCVSEFLSSFDNDNTIPNHGFESFESAIKMLAIENSVLELQAFRNIAAASETVNGLLQFLEKFKTYYPALYSATETLYINKEIKAEIDSVIDRFGEIHNNASETLYSLRKSIQGIRGKIGQSFTKALSHYVNLDYLDDIRESVIDNKRVLRLSPCIKKS